MQQNWRTSLKEQIETEYIHNKSQEWFDIFLSTAGNLDLTIVSNQFADIPFIQRREQIQNLLSQLGITFEIGMLSLYTPDEAKALGLIPSDSTEEQPIYSWYDLALSAANLDEMQMPIRRSPRNPRTITFYSFKGGVGRTTALTHIAWILAKRGRKVVAVDLDLEAPGLSRAFNLSSNLLYGIVDYFYERAYIPDGIKPRISVAEIFEEVRIPDAPGRLFVVPAGNLDLDYITKVGDLRISIITRTGEDLWTTFFNDINQQVQPDIILVDSRTGINEWGAFSLLRAADKAIVFLYPNTQNAQGIDLLLKALAGKISVQLVFSPVPLGEAGQQRVKEHWASLRQAHKNSLINPDESKLNNTDQNDSLSDEEELEEDSDSQIALAKPITIHYLTELAIASNFPVSSLISHYMNIANAIDEETITSSLEEALSHTTQRWKIIESLQFPEVNAADPRHNLRDLFQRTNDFDKFLDDATCLLRGRKGTGKTALYTLLLKHTDTAQELSRGRLKNVSFLSGHGSFQENRPTKSEFQFLDQTIQQEYGSWEAFWRSYLLLRMHQEGVLQKYDSRDAKFQQLRSLFRAIPKETNLWQTKHTKTLAKLSTVLDLNLLAKEWLFTINEQLHTNNQTLWFLYDDLDVDLESILREDALKGLFYLVQAFDAQRLTNIRFKIFLREDIWSRLTFDNKSHFNGRDIILQWTQVDFLRLALRQALQSQEFSELVNHFAPVGNIDQADAQTIEKALLLLWGNKRDPKSKYVSRWAYDRLTDSSKTTFPRSLNILLKEAKAHELATRRDEEAFPKDRLLRPQSLNQGLIRASSHRCQDLREEYPDLTSFFDSLKDLSIVASRDDLHRLWQKTIQDTLPEFKDSQKFIDFLLSIGLIGVGELRGKEQGYRFAEIYTHGFRIYRSTRKY